MKTAVASDDDRPDAICQERHDSGLRCWVRVHGGVHADDHMAVLPNVDRTVCTRPQVVYW